MEIEPLLFSPLATETELSKLYLYLLAGPQSGQSPRGRSGPCALPAIALDGVWRLKDGRNAPNPLEQRLTPFGIEIVQLANNCSPPIT